MLKLYNFNKILAEATEHISSLTESRQQALKDKFGYMAKRLPEEFTEETPYAIHAKSKNVRRD